jgi:hypothetical protein
LAEVNHAGAVVPKRNSVTASAWPYHSQPFSSLRALLAGKSSNSKSRVSS